MLNEVNMDFRIPGLPHSVVKHAQSTSVRELIQKIENHPNRHAFQQDLRQNQAYNPFSPESEEMIQDVGNIDLFELLETDSKTQCKACLSHWSEGIVYCTCGHLLKETVANRGIINYYWTLFHFQNTSSRREDFRATDVGNFEKIENIFWPIISKRDAERDTMKESMIDSCEMTFSVDEWLKTIEMKKFVEHGMFLQMRTTPIVCHKKNTSTTGTIGGSISISRAMTPNHWENVLISNKRCLHESVYTKKLEENKSSPFLAGSTNNGERHRVLPLLGGNGKILGGLLQNSKKVKKDEARKGLWLIGTTRYFQNFGANP